MLNELGGWARARQVAHDHMWPVIAMAIVLPFVAIAAVVVPILVADPQARFGYWTVFGIVWVAVSWICRAGLATQIQLLLQDLADEHLREVAALKEEPGRMCWDQIRDVASERLSLVAQEINSRIVEKGLIYGADTYGSGEGKERVQEVQRFFRSAGNSGANILLEFASDEDE